MLSELEVGYSLGISNPVTNARKYLTSSQKAVNMGVYGADLSYATLYNIQQEVLNYLDAIRSLANELNMSQIYDETLYDRIRQNQDKKEELVSILTEAFDETYAYLSENDQEALALLVVGGAWVEGMYLTTHVSEAAYQVAGISKVLIEQKESFDLFIEITEPYLSDPKVKEFVDKLEPVKKVYSGLTTSLTNQNIIDITKAIETRIKLFNIFAYLSDRKWIHLRSFFNRFYKGICTPGSDSYSTLFPQNPRRATLRENYTRSISGDILTGNWKRNTLLFLKITSSST